MTINSKNIVMIFLTLCWTILLLFSPAQSYSSFDPAHEPAIKNDGNGRIMIGVEKKRYVDDEVVFQFKDKKTIIKAKTVAEAKAERKKVHDQLRQDIGNRHKLRDTRKLFRKARKEKLERVNRAKVPVGKTVEETLAALVADPDIEWAEPNYIHQVQATPNDPDYSIQQNPEYSGMNIPAAWDVTTGNSNVVVAVLDTGVDWTHPDLVDNIWVNSGEIADDLIDNDGNGFVDDVRGWDFVEVSSGSVFAGEDYGVSDNDPMDFHGHGTHVSGIVGAKGNNGIGISGVNWDVSIMPIRAGYKDIYGQGLLSITAIGEGLVYACDNGANIINMSYGSPYASSTERQALEYCADMGVVLVGAAGNSNTTSVHFPAAFPQVFSVASVTLANKRSSFSNYGTWIDGAAYGDSIYSTLVGGGYGPKSGTSMASPMVAGVAALVKAANPGWTRDQILTQLRSTAVDINTQNSSIINLLGGGLVQAQPALAGLVSNPRMGTISLHIEEVLPGNEDGIMTSGESFTIRPTIRNFGSPQIDIQLSMQSADPYITITDATVNIPGLGFNERATEKSDVFSVSISPAAPDDHSSTVNIMISQGGSLVQTDQFEFQLNPDLTSSVLLADGQDDPQYLDCRIFTYSDNSLTVLYRRQGFSMSNVLLARHRTSDGNWGPETVVPNVPGFLSTQKYDAVVDSQDRLHVVSLSWEATWDDEIIHVIWNNATSNWETPEQLSISASPYVSGHLTVSPAIAVDSNDNPHVGWVDYRSGTVSEIYFMSYDGLSWSSENVVAQ